MDACIARGGISHVLSQARASLKNPSRPYTPQTSARPLFQGDDYRPGSRPSSSYTVAELKQMAEQQTHQTTIPTTPKKSIKLPLRTSGLKTRPVLTPPSSEKRVSIGTASTGSLKLVHAPILSDDESDDGDLIVADDGNKNCSETHLDLEASLTLPSNDELTQSYRAAKSCIQDLLDQGDAISGVDRLHGLVDTFVGLSSFLQAGGKHISDNTAATKLRLKLFDALSNVLLDKLTRSAACVLKLAPALLDLYRITSAGDDRDKINAQLIKIGKTLFILSKDKANDGNFCNVQYVESVLHAIAETSKQVFEPVGNIELKELKEADHQEETALCQPLNQQSFPMKMLIYTAGTLKNISNAEDKMIRLLATNRAIVILSETMLWRAEDDAKSKEIAQFLIQTTGILRNLSVAKSYYKQLLEAEIPTRLCNMIPIFITHQELMVNISRILSKLTLHELPRAQINQRSSNVQLLISLVDYHQNPWLSLVEQQRSETRFQDLLFIRVFFVLGNLCAGNDQNRRLVAIKFSGVSLLLEVLQFYSARYSDARNNDEGKESGDRQCSIDAEQAMEVLVKLVRVLANLAINAEVGALLNESEGIASLLDILEIAQCEGDEELMLNAVSCITNVSYYSSTYPSELKSVKVAVENSDYCFVETNCIAITRLLARILLDRNEEAVVEATRAFGNLSRFKDVVALMSELKVLDCLVVLLDHGNREIVHTVCGVLMNAALDGSTRQALLEVRPIANNDAIDVRSLLVGIVECAAEDDLEMTLIASKALYNLLLSKHTSQGNFVADALNLRRVIEEVLSTISHQHAERGIDRDAGELNEDYVEEASDSSNSRQELRLVLPQLLRNVNTVCEAT